MEIPTAVSVSINSAIDSLSAEPIEGRLRRRRYKKDIRKKRNRAYQKYRILGDRLMKDLQNARTERDDAFRAYQEAGDDDSKLQLLSRLTARRAKVGRVKRHVRDLQRAIADSDLSGRMEKEWEDLEFDLRDAIKGIEGPRRA